MKHLQRFKLYEHFDMYNFRSYDNTDDLEQIVEQIYDLGIAIPIESKNIILESISTYHIPSGTPNGTYPKEILFSEDKDTSMYFVKYIGDYCYALIHEHIYDPFDYFDDNVDFPRYGYVEIFDDLEPLLDKIKEIISKF